MSDMRVAGCQAGKALPLQWPTSERRCPQERHHVGYIGKSGLLYDKPAIGRYNVL